MEWVSVKWLQWAGQSSEAYFFILLLLLTTVQHILLVKGFYFKADRDRLKCVQLELSYHCDNIMKM